MQVKGEIVYAFNGTSRDTLWGIDLPPFDGSALGISFDAFAGPASVVPFRYDAGTTYFIVNKGDPSVQCMTFVFCLAGTLEEQDAQFKLIGQFTHALKYDWEKFHTAYRPLKNEETGATRTFVYRVYENTDECMEHPEMLCGAPMGMYHCPVCMEMVVAGIPHPPKEAYEEMHAQEHAEMQTSGIESPWTLADWKQRGGRIKRVYFQAENTLNTYATLEHNWGGDGEEKPVAASLKNAGEFFATIKEHKLPSPEVTLDHEGVVAFLWPDNHDPKDMYVSMAFYADETVTYWMERSTKASSGNTVPRDENHEENMLTFLRTYLPQLAPANGED